MSTQNVNIASLAMLNETFSVIFKHCVTFFQDQKPVKRDIIFLQEMHLVFKRHLTHCMGCLVLPNFSSFFVKKKNDFCFRRRSIRRMKKGYSSVKYAWMPFIGLFLCSSFEPYWPCINAVLLTLFEKSNFCPKIQFWQNPQHFGEFFTQNFFDNFSREIKVVNS